MLYYDFNVTLISVAYYKRSLIIDHGKLQKTFSMLMIYQYII